MLELPKLVGIPPAQLSGELALPGVPTSYLIPGLLSNTHDSHTVWPAVNDTGLLRLTVCQPADELTIASEVTPNLESGEPEASL